MADEKYKLIGVVRANATTMTKGTDANPDGRQKAEVKIEDVAGVTATWGTFHTSIAKELELGKWYEFEVQTPAKKEGSGVWHNLEAVLRGPIDRPTPGTPAGDAAAAATGPAHTVKSDQQFTIERTSLQRQGAMGIVVRLIEAGIPLDQLEETVEVVLKHATTVEAFYERPIDQPEPAKAKRSRAKTAQQPVDQPEAPAAAAPAQTNGAVPDFAHVGELLTWFTARHKGKTSRDLCELLEVKGPTAIVDYAAAAKAADERWGVPA